MNFFEQYKQPNWQKKRLEILERDEFTCMSCDDTESQLQVHHKSNKKNTKVWDYDNDNFVTLCKDCHSKITELKRFAKSIIDETFISHDVSKEFLELLSESSQLNLYQLSETNKYVVKIQQ